MTLDESEREIARLISTMNWLGIERTIELINLKHLNWIYIILGRVVFFADAVVALSRTFANAIYE